MLPVLYFPSQEVLLRSVALGGCAAGILGRVEVGSQGKTGRKKGSSEGNSVHQKEEAADLIK